MSLLLYIQISKFENCNSSFSREPSFPILLSTISHSILVQITPHKAQTSSFFILFHLNRLKFQITPSNGGTIKEAKGFFESNPTTFRDSRNADSLLHFLFLIVLNRRTTDTVQKSFLFSFPIFLSIFFFSLSTSNTPYFDVNHKACSMWKNTKIVVVNLHVWYHVCLLGINSLF